MRCDFDVEALQMRFERFVEPRRIGIARASVPPNRGTGTDHANIQPVLSLISVKVRGKSISLSTKDCGISHSSAAARRARHPPDTP